MTRKSYQLWSKTYLPDGTSHEDWIRANAASYTVDEICDILKRTRVSVTQKLYVLGITAKAIQPKPDDLTEGIGVEDFLKAIKNKPRSRKELSQEFDRSEDTIDRVVEGLRRKAYEITETASERVIWSTRATSAVPPPPNLWDETYGEFIIGKISDFHFGSKWAQISNLRRCVQEMYEEGVRRVLVPGDAFAGNEVYKGQIHDLVTPSGPEQVALGVEYLPRYDDLKYRFIGGNHDFSFIKQNGYNPVWDLCNKRDDCEYCGFDMADVPITPLVDARLWHPMGGVPYAYCLSSDTQILTKRGWIGYREISLSDQVATLNPASHIIEYQQPDELFIQKHSGDMLHFGGSTFDLLVTADHDLYVNEAGDRRGHGWRKVPARYIAEGWSRQRYMFFQSGTWNGEEASAFTIPSDGEWSGKVHLGLVPMEPWLRFLGWWISEGHSMKGKCLEFTQKAGPNLDEIADACRGIGLKPREYAHSGDVKRIRVYNAELCRWVEKHCGKGAGNKRVPRFIMNLSPRLIGVFLDALFKGDGSFRNARLGTYTSKSDGLLDDVQELLLKVGLVGVRRGDENPDRASTIGVQQQSLTPALLDEPTELTYDGIVWCVKVPNGLILARRNGKPVWTGNSYRMQKHVEEMAFAELLKVLRRKESPRVIMLDAGHLHIALDFWAGPILCMQIGCFEGQTPYLKRKGKTPFIGGTITWFQITSGQMLRAVTYRQLQFDEIDNDYLDYPIPREETIELEPWFQWTGAEGDANGGEKENNEAE